MILNCTTTKPRAVALLVGLTACAPTPHTATPAPQSAPGPIALEQCTLGEVEIAALCGTYRVYEDRETRAGRSIDLRVVMVPAESAVAAPDPLLVLAGSPGQAATELVQAVKGPLAPVHRDRDIVFIDQRGTGASNPSVCPDDRQGRLKKGPEHDERWAACLQALEEHADVRFYTTPLAVDDFD